MRGRKEEGGEGRWRIHLSRDSILAEEARGGLMPIVFMTRLIAKLCAGEIKRFSCGLLPSSGVMPKLNIPSSGDMGAVVVSSSQTSSCTMWYFMGCVLILGHKNQQKEKKKKEKGRKKKGKEVPFVHAQAPPSCGDMGAVVFSFNLSKDY
jgi:hypothetical protein